ncbi:helix-turn-helix domain-containing protein [Kitasatospora sp. A2-31]|uniref:helix-turn-helix domain-containing protein n=1 Tax=Kitasatospora sp. A2-31 TaxID=2916414 RepID=UPI001EEA48F3|nr:helix-turn-helix transcriptional regulator [Kitasatospora sp. A2-31]MCG6498395.1 helix-turn-helix domain-containing protein [Kitasatospora sp. A2-31]
MGQRVGRLRETFGLSRAQVADAVGRNPEWLRTLEAGRQRIDRYAMVGALAEALGVLPGDLLGVPCGREDAGAGAVHRALPALRRAVLRLESPAAVEAAPERVDRLRRRLTAMNGLRRDARWTDLALGLPALLDDLRSPPGADRATDGLQSLPDEGRDGSDRGTEGLRPGGPRPGGARAEQDGAGPEPARLLTEALHEAALLAKRLGACDLAALAAAEARRSALAAGDPALVASTRWLQAEVALSSGATDEAAVLLEAGLAATDRLLGRADRHAWAVWGTLHLVSAVLEGQRGRQAECSAHLAEAAAAVAHTDPSTAGSTGFGEAEWAVHAVHAALELGEDLGALGRIDGVDLRPLPADRRARHGIDRARALARAGDAAGAAAELLAADRVGSQVVRTHPLVGELLRTAPTRATAEAAAALGVRL